MEKILKNFQNIQKKGKDYWAKSNKSPKITAQIFKKNGARLMTLSGHLDENEKPAIFYHFDTGEKTYNIKHQTKNNQIDSIVNIFPTADWIEREIYETYGIKFKGHKNLTNLIVTTKNKTPLLKIEKEKSKIRENIN